jgi:hypothetical protein
LKKLLEKIEGADFHRPVKHLLITSVLVLLLCGVLNAFMFRTQIAEIQNYHDSQTEIIENNQINTKESQHREHDHDQEEVSIIDNSLITPPSSAAIAVGITSLVLCCACAVSYWLMVVAWLYKASSKVGLNKVLWGVLGLLTNLIALAAFFIVQSQRMQCSSCGTWQKKAPYCTSCGAQLQNLCPKCGKICSAEDAFCSHCGTALKDSNNEEEEDD